MDSSLREDFNQRGIFDAAPDFLQDFMMSEMFGTWGDINCLGWALGSKSPQFHDLYHYYRYNMEDLRAEKISGLIRLLSGIGVDAVEGNNLLNIRDGHYPIAGFIDPKTSSPDEFHDYHWFRMDNTGMWSHKDGWGRAITNCDASNKLIVDPSVANRRSISSDYNYTMFLGFFAVPKGGVELPQVEGNKLIPANDVANRELSVLQRVCKLR